MHRQLIAALLIALAAPAAAADLPVPKPVEVMVLGTYHFGNPGKDLNNIKADSVLTPGRQAELERLAAALADWKPTRVMVEMESEAPDFAVAEYGRFDKAMLAKDANEIVQIGYRTAREAGLRTVNGIDERSKAGEPDYFPYDKVQETAAKFGQTAILDNAGAAVTTEMKAFEAAQRGQSVAKLLLRLNEPGTPTSGMDFYYGILPIGDGNSQPGADLNAMWYLRNAKIFAKLMQAAKPGDRVLVVYGAGHAFWLRHFAQFVPGYRDVDVRPLLAGVR